MAISEWINERDWFGIDLASGKDRSYLDFKALCVVCKSPVLYQAPIPEGEEQVIAKCAHCGADLQLYPTYKEIGPNEYD